MLDPSLERAVVILAHDDVYVPLVLVDERLPKGCEISGRRVVCHPLSRGQQNERLARLQGTAFPLQPYARGLPGCAPQIKTV